MKKEEFPTFLNEQPTIIFGRTGRELLIMTCGLSATYSLWGAMDGLHSSLGGTVLSVLVVAIPFALSIIVALISIAGRPLEEWFFVLMLYLLMPKLFLYEPLQEEEEHRTSEKDARLHKRQVAARDEEDES